MPVKLERPEQLSPQDIIDLNKLQADLGQAEKDDWQAELTAALSSGAVLINGRFNDRVVVRAWLQPNVENTYQIDDLAVRKVTRNRGVARQLLIVLCRYADQQGWDLAIDTKHEFSQAQVFNELGFVKQGDQLQRQAQQ